MKIRQETPADYDAITKITTKAFRQADEAQLISQLRKDGDIKISLVAYDENNIIGHIALSCLKSPKNALALGPVSVIPEKQKQGVGITLINHAIAQAQQKEVALIFVLGDPAYYTRFGFSVDLGAQYPCPYAGPYFMGLNLLDCALPPAAIIYPNAFNEL